MTAKLQSPHAFPERFLLFGGGGAGKTNTVLNIMSHMPEGMMHVIDTDYSMPYDRALATDFADIIDRVDVNVVDTEWDPFCEGLADTVGRGDPEIDWLVLDTISPSWESVQNWYLEQVYGHDLPAHLIELRKTYADDLKAYHKALTEDMNWSAVKKEYGRRVWIPIRNWKGNLIICAEAKSVGRDDNDETRMLYGPLGFKPTGEARLSHVAATNLFLDHPNRGTWRMTTIKDRNRGELEHTVIDDFGMDYLVEIAGWVPVRRARLGGA
jgi:hypothetical protein